MINFFCSVARACGGTQGGRRQSGQSIVPDHVALRWCGRRHPAGGGALRPRVGRLWRGLHGSVPIGRAIFIAARICVASKVCTVTDTSRNTERANADTASCVGTTVANCRHPTGIESCPNQSERQPERSGADRSRQTAFWVEYGAYDGPFYARRLVARLGATGVTTEIKQVHGVGGRRYYSVRSTGTSDRTGAGRYIRLAAIHLGIAPLLHRGDGWAPAKPVVAKPPSAARADERETGYWVQFGAFDRPGYAQTLRERLSRAGVNTTIVERHRPGRARFLVRSAASLHRIKAQSLAARGASLLGIVPLVGHSLKQDRRNL